jgi:7-carboxy-7-deazaguanine synthase
MAYSVKEIFYTLQGEGAQAGRPAVFCRFSGCNLWSGRQEDRFRANCRFCDTDFVGTNGTAGGVFDDAQNSRKISQKRSRRIFHQKRARW